MNRKLKNMLKNTYGSKLPDRKYKFIQELKCNPAWKKLHPISSVVNISSVVKFILASAIATFTGITAYNSIRNVNDDEPPTPYIPPVLTTSVYDTDTVYTTTSGFTVTTTSYATAISAVTDTSHLTASTSTHTTTSTCTEPPETEISFVPETTATATDIYSSHIFRHDYTLEELQENESLLYGYPENDIARQLFGAYDNTDYVTMSITFTDSIIIDGEITAVEYVLYEGKPWTICDVYVNEVFDFYYDDVMNKGDIVRIATAGGFVGAREYIALNPDDETFSAWSDERINSTVIYEDGGNEVMPEVSDKRLYVLNHDTFNLNGEEVRTCLAYSDLFQFYRDGEIYISFNTASDGKITYDNLYRITHDDNCYIYEPDGERCLLIKNESFLLSGNQTYYSVSPDGYISYLGETSTDDGFFPYDSADDYSITWTDTEVIIEYRYDTLQTSTRTISLPYNIITT